VHLWALGIKSELVVGINRNLVLNPIKKKNYKTKLISRVLLAESINHGTALDIGNRASWLYALLLLAENLSYPSLLWIFNPCTSMGVGHQVKTSCLHQQEPGAEAHQEEKFQNKLDQQS
jgi:hypothetical protein